MAAKHSGQFSCGYCSRAFSRRLGLDRHVSQVHGGQQNDLNGLEEEETRPPDGGGSPSSGFALPRDKKGRFFACPDCPYYTVRKWDLVRHRDARHNGVVYGCRRCDYTTAFKHKLKSHVKQRHTTGNDASEEEEMFSDPVTCVEVKAEAQLWDGAADSSVGSDFSYEEPGAVDWTGGRRPKFSCPLCGSSYTRRHGLKRHLESKHPGESDKFGLAELDELYSWDAGRHIAEAEEAAGWCEQAGRGRAGLYQCPDCPYSTIRKYDLARHSNARHKGVVYRCEYCAYTTAFKHKLKPHVEHRHMWTETCQPDVADCLAVSLEVPGTDDDGGHQMSEEEEEEGGDALQSVEACWSGQDGAELVEGWLGGGKVARYTCDFCPSSYTRSNDLRRHLETKHGSGDVGDDSLGLFDQQTVQSLSGEEETNLESEPVNTEVKLETWLDEKPAALYACDLCGCSFPTRKELRAHAESQHSSSSLGENCEGDDKSPAAFSEKIESDHCASEGREETSGEEERSCGEAGPGRYVCSDCDYSTPRKWDLVRHTDARHMGIVYSCGHCPYTTAFKHKLKPHVNKKHPGLGACLQEEEAAGMGLTAGGGGGPLRCEHCGYTTRRSHDLRRHVDARHGGAEFRCWVCGHGARLYKELRQHVRERHQRRAMHSCPLCGYSTGRRADLKRHVDKRHVDKGHVDKRHVDKEHAC